MIKIANKENSVAPLVLTQRGIIAASNLKLRFDAGETQFLSADFDGGIYGHPDVKALLISIQHDKCCFCESKISHISYGDVEHFRPKAGWVQENEELNKPGYYWIAYDWMNLFFSCEVCNRRYKKNFFPLINNNTRATSHHLDINREDPLFLNPAEDDVECFITFAEEVPIAINGNDRGIKTIEALKLDRPSLNERRMETLGPIRIIYELAKSCPDTPQHIKERARHAIDNYYNLSQLDSTQYASMLRAFFSANPIDF